MSKKTIYIVLTFLLIMLLVGFFIMSKKIGPQTEGGEDQRNGNFLSNLLPFKESGTSRTQNDSLTNLGNPNLTEESATKAALQQLTIKSIAGFIATTTEDGSSVLRYMDRATGNIFEINLETFQSVRITNTTFPEVYDMVWHKNAKDFVLRYVNKNEVIKTYIGSVVESTTTDEMISGIEGVFIDDEIENLITNKNNTKFVYTIPKNLGVLAIVSEFNTENPEIIFESGFGEWTLDWINENTITATTRGSFSADGFAYTVDINSGVFKKVLGNLRGLAIRSNKELTKILYSDSFGSITGNVQLSLFDVESRTSTKLPIRTFAEKCVWNSARARIAYCGVPTQMVTAEYPDMWYQGVVSFSDSIWKIDSETNTATEIIKPLEETNASIDAINLSTDKNGNYLFFINKKDSTLWSLKLEQPVEETIEEVVEEEVIES